MKECKFDEHERIWSGQKRELLYDYDCSIGRILYNALRNYPKNVSQICDIDGRTVTNAEVLLWATRFAQHLKKLSLQPDDVVGIVAKNSTYLMPVAVGCFMNCTIFHAVNSNFDQNTLQYVFNITKPKVILCDEDVYDKVYKATKSLQPLIYTLHDHVDDAPRIEDILLHATHSEQSVQSYRPESLTEGGKQTVAILCSSGTTGIPKVVCVSNYTLAVPNVVLTSEDVVYGPSSLDWLVSLAFSVICLTVGCTRIITNRPYSPEYFIQLVQKYKITYAAMVQRHLTALIGCATATKENLSSIAVLVVNVGSTSPASLKGVNKIFPKTVFRCGYALTETGGVALNFGWDYRSVGKILPGVRVRIVDDEGKNLGHNEVGEILVHTGLEWNGYFGNLTETQHIQDSLGWFHTGDLGYFDDKNFMFVVDRKEDTLKYQGFYYWPGEIERVIIELPEVEEVCVVGVYDETVGDRAGALVVRKDGCNLSAQQVVEHVRQRLPSDFKQLYAGVRFTQKLPLNASGKIVRKAAKALFETMRN